LDTLTARKLIITKIIFALMLLVLISGSSGWMVSAQDGGGEGEVPDSDLALLTKLDQQERLRVIVQLKIPGLTNKTAELNTPAIHTAQSDLLSTLSSNNVRLIHQYDYIPFMAVEVDRAGLEGLMRSPLVVGVEEDILMKPLLSESVPLINADDVWAAGYTGEGQMVAVLDTGVDKNHPALAGKVVSEACYSSTSSTTTSLCPGGVSASIETDSALPYISNCPSGECDHGTHVAGIVAANGASVKGIAKDAKLIAIQVFSRVSSNSIGSWSSDQIKGLERVYTLRNSYQIAAINLSLGSEEAYTTTCDNLGSNIAYKASVDKLRSVGIVTVAASGNEHYINAISSPACISTIVSVGATTDADTVANYSNSASFLDLLAPGSSINSTIPGGGYAIYNGTSMAAPHVAGAWALLRSYDPSATIDEILYALKNTGIPINDSRNSIILPRIDVFDTAPLLRPFKPTNLTATDGTLLDKVNLMWTQSEYATYYQVFRSPKNLPETANQLITNHVVTNFDDTTAEPGIIYHYWVKACSPAGCSDLSLSDEGWKGYTVVPPPSDVLASDGEFQNKVRITWNRIGGAESYKVFRNFSDTTIGVYEFSDIITGNSFDDFTAALGNTYYYWIQACNNSGCSEYSASDSGYVQSMPTSWNIYLPLLNKNYAVVDPIKNGDFELGRDGSWTEYSSNGFELVINKDYPYAPPPHSGSWEAWLGGDDYEVSRLSQVVTISSANPYLHFWYWIGSADTYCDYDFFRLKINNGEVLKLDLCTSTNTGGWRERVVNLSAYNGTSVTLMFEVTNDFYLNSNFFLDDVSMSSVSTVSTAVVEEMQVMGDVTSRKVK